MRAVCHTKKYILQQDTYFLLYTIYAGFLRPFFVQYTHVKTSVWQSIQTGCGASVAYTVRDREAGGSIPPTPTIYLFHMTAEYPILPFDTEAAFEKWLEKNHDTEAGIWLRLYKKATGIPTVTYDEALDVALCYGWIDGQKKGLDERSFLLKFTPRGKRSMWSARNQQHVARLIKEKRMQPAGLAEVKRAKEDGRWQQTYVTQSEAELPEDFVAALQKEPKHVQEFAASLNRSNIFAIYFRLTMAKKPETRERRFQQLLQMLRDGKKLH